MDNDAILLRRPNAVEPTATDDGAGSTIPCADAPSGHDACRTVALSRDLLLANRIFGFERLDSRAQPFMNLRSQIVRKLGAMQGQVLAVTSTQPANGKSFVATNLAASLSRIHPVRLLDLDLKRPTVARQLGLNVEAGIDDYLQGFCPHHSIELRVRGEDLTVMPTRMAQDDASALLCSPRLATLVATQRSSPDAPICIIDTPPVFEGDDLLLIAKHADAILLVIEEGRTRQRELHEALRIITPTPLLGTVLNRTIGPSTSASYGYYRPPAEAGD